MSIDVFEPGKYLMRRLRMPAKFSIILITLLIPLIMLLYLYVRKSNADIEFARNERVGVQYHAQIHPIIDAVLQHRGQALLRLLNVEEKLHTDEAAKTVENGITDLDNKLQVADPFHLRPTLSRISDAWFKAQNDTYTETAQITEKYTKVNDALLEMRRQISEASNLALDPDIDSYYLMMVSTDKLPAMTANLAPLRGLVAFVAGNPAQAEKTRIRIAIFSALINRDRADAKDALDRVALANPEAIKKLNLQVFEMVDAYLKLIQKSIMETVSGDAKDIYNKGSNVINANSALTI
jgi:DNA-binding TFAR19-related protein (PDSD5 family)